MPRLAQWRPAVRVFCKYGHIDCTDRESFRQADGRMIRAIDLTAQQSVPGLGPVTHTVRLHDNHLIELHRVRPISNTKP